MPVKAFDPKIGAQGPQLNRLTTIKEDEKRKIRGQQRCTTFHEQCGPTLPDLPFRASHGSALSVA